MADTLGECDVLRASCKGMQVLWETPAGLQSRPSDLWSNSSYARRCLGFIKATITSKMSNAPYWVSAFSGFVRRLLCTLHGGRSLSVSCNLRFAIYSAVFWPDLP